MVIYQIDTQRQLSMKYNNLVYDHMMMITLLYSIINMIEVNIWKDWIVTQVITKLGGLKIDNRGDTVMSSPENT